MHDKDELHLKPSLHITHVMFNDRSNRVPGGEQRVHDNAKVFNLEVGLI